MEEKLKHLSECILLTEKAADVLRKSLPRALESLSKQADSLTLEDKDRLEAITLKVCEKTPLMIEAFEKLKNYLSEKNLLSL